MRFQAAVWRRARNAMAKVMRRAGFQRRFMA
jgi:hypothetical protein